MDKKGTLGLDTAKAVFVWFLILAVLAIALMLALSSLRTPVEDLDQSTETLTNETTGTLGDTKTELARIASDTYRNSVCSSHVFTNSSSDGETIEAANYTLSDGDCAVLFVVDSEYRNGTVNVTYSATYSNPETNWIVQNISAALTNNFFNQTSTIFAIIIVVIIILAIAIIIAVVTRFGAGGGVGVAGREFGGDTVMGV